MSVRRFFGLQHRQIVAQLAVNPILDLNEQRAYGGAYILLELSLRVELFKFLQRQRSQDAARTSSRANGHIQATGQS